MMFLVANFLIAHSYGSFGITNKVLYDNEIIFISTGFQRGSLAEFMVFGCLRSPGLHEA